MEFLLRLFLSPFGLLYKFVEIVKSGSRDIRNKLFFRKAIIERGCCINRQSKVEPYVRIFGDCTINNTSVSSYTYIGGNCLVQNAKIGRFCSIAPDCLIGLGNHPLEMFSTSPIFYRKENPLKYKLLEDDLDVTEYRPIDIGHDVWIGARVIILDGVTIGTGSVIAAGSVVTKNVPSYAVVAGVPAKVIKYRFSELIIERLLDSMWWAWTLEKILEEMPKQIQNM